MKLCMEACNGNDVTFVVLDSPNPLSCAVQETILNENLKILYEFLKLFKDTASLQVSLQNILTSKIY